MSVYITGDKHGELGLIDLVNWSEGKNLSKDDYLIIAGDFGGLFYGSSKDEKILQFYENQPYTTLFIDGNHENFDLLESYPVEEWHGGKIHRISPSIIHLMRGQIFYFEGHSIFTMGGATSTDRGMRINKKSWWSRELPAYEEYLEADDNLAKHNNKVDYIVTHCCSARQYYRFSGCGLSGFYHDPLTDYFDEIERQVKFTHWWYGHWHDDINVDSEHTMITRKIIKII